MLENSEFRFDNRLKMNSEDSFLEKVLFVLQLELLVTNIR